MKQLFLLLLSMGLFSGAYAQCGPFSLPYSDDFENGLGCWIQSTADDFDWTLDAGGTTSSNTGPSVDHTTGTSTGNYVYLETSGPSAGDQAILESSVIDLTGTSVALVEFYYHMFGATMGTMLFDIEAPAGSGTWTNLWSLSGNQGNQWLYNGININAYTGQSVRFRFIGIRGTSFTGDMAFDDFSVQPTSCPAPTALSASNGTSTSFDVNFTSSAVSVDLEYGVGPFTPGTGAGTVVTGVTSPYNLSGLNLLSSYEVYVRNICATDTSGWSGPITYTTGCPASFTPTFTTDFDGILSNCWTQDTNDQLDWTLNSGSTTSSNTGPSGDHTTGTGNYLYLETSTGSAGNEANYISPDIDLTTSTVAFLDFWYHMFGATIGTLNVDIEAPSGSGTWTNLWTLSGDQGNSWKKGSIDLSTYVGQTVSIRFKGIRGTSFTGDIAIDDIKVSNTLPGTTCDNFFVLDTNGVYTIDSITTGFGASQSDADHAVWFTFTPAQNGTIDLGSCGQGVDTRLWIYTGDCNNLTLYEAVDDNCNLGLGTGDWWASHIYGLEVTAGVTYYIEWDDHWEDLGFDMNFEFYPSSSITTSPTTFSFEGGSEGWLQPVTDDTYWSLDDSGTPSSGTGPSAAFDGNDYFFIEGTTTNNPGDVAILRSPAFDLSNPTLSGAEMSFAYHMFGTGQGSLSVEASTDAGTTWASLWTLSGDQGDQWLEASVDLSAYLGGFVWVRFVGITGSNFSTDMAIDKVTMNAICGPAVASTTTTDITCNGDASGTIDLALGSGFGGVLISEVGLDTPDFIEITNAGSSPIDVTGWTVVCSDSYTNINTLNSTPQTLSGTLNPGDVLFWTDNTSDPNYWGSNLFFNPGNPGWVVILDNTGAVVDAVFWSWLSADISGMSAYSIGAQWSGDGVDPNCGVGSSIERGGTSDGNTLADFSCNAQTPGTTNLVAAPTFTWSTGDTTTTLTGLSGGVYTVEVSAGYCSISITDTITEPDAIVLTDTTVQNEVGAGGTGFIDVTVTGGTPPLTYAWSNGATTEDIDSLTAGDYSLVVTDANNCVDSFSFTIMDWVNTTGLNKVDRLGVSPNPTNGNLNIDLELTENARVQVSVFNALGQEIMRLPQESLVTKRFLLDLTDQPNGMYHIRIIIDDQVIAKQVMLTR